MPGAHAGALCLPARQVHSAAEKEENEAKFREIAEVSVTGARTFACSRLPCSVAAVLGVRAAVAPGVQSGAAAAADAMPHTPVCGCVAHRARAPCLLPLACIVQAYEVLSDDEKRGAYDRGEDLEPQGGGGPGWGHPHGFHQQGGGFQFHFNF